MRLVPSVYRVESSRTGTVVGTLSHVEGSAWWRAEWLPLTDLVLPQQEPQVRWFDGRYAAQRFFEDMKEE